MREFKFRAWHKENKWMISMDDGYVFQFFGSDFYITASDRRIDISYDKDEVELMEFTGGHAKNSKEIWEDDIIRTSSGKIGQVKFSERHACWVVEYKDDSTYPLTQLGEKEIIGNIYEKPELLTIEYEL